MKYSPGLSRTRLTSAPLGKLSSGAPISAERGPDSDVETLEFFAKRVGEFNKNREDVTTWFDLLDLDDYVTFGGRA